MTRTGIAIMCTLMMASGCTSFMTSGQSADMQAQAGKLAEAQQLQREGKFAEANSIYQRIIQEQPASEWAADARFGSALLHADPDNKRRDYAQALEQFEEFLDKYPLHQRAPEARSWRQLLKSSLECRKENERLNKNIERLKQLDVKQEERRMGR